MVNSEIIEKKYAESVKGLKNEWFENASSKWYDYILDLPMQCQITYLIVVLHNQVINGGFHQYFSNGYGQFAKETIKALQEIGAIKKSALLETAFKKVNTENYNTEVFRKKLLKKEIKSLFVEDDLVDILDKLDEEYYSNEEDVEKLLSEYLLESRS